MFFSSLHCLIRTFIICLRSYRPLINCGGISSYSSSYVYKIGRNTMRWDQMDWTRYLISFLITGPPTSLACSFISKSPFKNRTISESWYTNFLSKPSYTRTKKRTTTIKGIQKKRMKNLLATWDQERICRDSLILNKNCKKPFPSSCFFSSETSSIPTWRTSKRRPICISTTFYFNSSSMNWDSWKQKCKELYWILWCFRPEHHQTWTSFWSKCIVWTSFHWSIQMVIDRSCSWTTRIYLAMGPLRCTYIPHRTSSIICTWVTHCFPGLKITAKNWLRINTWFRMAKYLTSWMWRMFWRISRTSKMDLTPRRMASSLKAKVNSRCFRVLYTRIATASRASTSLSLSSFFLLIPVQRVRSLWRNYIWIWKIKLKKEATMHMKMSTSI